MSQVAVGEKMVGDGQSVYVIAEIGINHNGSVELACELIDAAAEMGCQAVKFQKRTIPVVYSEEELARSREVPVDVVANAIKRGVLATASVARLAASNLQDATNGDLKWALEFNEDEYRVIDTHCRKRGIHWFASPWDAASVGFLEQFDMPAYKVASASLTDDQLLRRIRSTGKPVILSTGMSSIEEVDHAVEVLGKENLIILHCTSTYPSKAEELNLRCIPELRQRYGVPIGYSGHEAGISTSVAAATLGACVVERHITKNRAMWGSDQAASVEIRGFERLVRELRTLEAALGDGKKVVYESEVPIREKLRKVKGIASAAQRVAVVAS
jgi:N-acetylneuraminate synthase